jgi:hypothetical protein
LRRDILPGTTNFRQEGTRIRPQSGPKLFFEKRGQTVPKRMEKQDRKTGQNMYLHKHGVFWPDDEQSPRIIGRRKPPMLKTESLSRKVE